MKKNLQSFLYILISCISYSAFAQKDNVGIGTTTPDQSAILDLNSSSKGLLMPRMNLQQRISIQNPAKGLIVFQSDFQSGFYFYDGREWKPLAETKSNSIAADPNDWSLNGNTNATNAHFIGTPAGTTDVPINFKIAGVRSGTISTSNLFLGYTSGVAVPSTYNSVGIGNYVLNAVTTGHSNVAIGSRALTSTTTGSANLAIGAYVLNNNIDGGQNVGMGYYSLEKNTSGSNNTALGGQALRANTTGSNNIGIGNSALIVSTNGSNNLALGSSALGKLTTGSSNTAIGREAMFSSVSGSGNVAIGNQAGYNETGSNKLYISNSNTANPLIKGEFDNKNLKINLGATKSSTVGFLAVGNFDASFPMPTGNSYRLIVQDGIITEKVKVALKNSGDWADYVFEPSYKLMSLDDVESFVKENKHLPNVPSAEDMAKNGLDVSQTSAKLMEKIEELTLYLIELNKEIKVLKAENKLLKK